MKVLGTGRPPQYAGRHGYLLGASRRLTLRCVVPAAQERYDEQEALARAVFEELSKDL